MLVTFSYLVVVFLWYIKCWSSNPARFSRELGAVWATAWLSYPLATACRRRAVVPHQNTVPPSLSEQVLEKNKKKESNCSRLRPLSLTRAKQNAASQPPPCETSVTPHLRWWGFSIIPLRLGCLPVVVRREWREWGTFDDSLSPWAISSGGVRWFWNQPPSSVCCRASPVSAQPASDQQSPEGVGAGRAGRWGVCVSKTGPSSGTWETTHRGQAVDFCS